MAEPLPDTGTDNASNTNNKLPRIVSFAFTAFKVLEGTNKWEARCRTCKAVINESRGTTSGFVK